jgi:D-alanyl-D-alanine carboxypeptidase
MKKWLLFVGIALIVGGIVFFVFFSSSAEAPSQPINQTSTDNSPQPEPSSEDFDKQQFSIDQEDSIWLVVNKQRPISESYVPSDLVDVDVAKRGDKSAEELKLRQASALALQELFESAQSSGVNLLLGSAYRSADLQATYYNNYVANFGQAEADRFSAKPGTSEHQTGLSADLSGIDKACYLETCFAETTEGKWLAGKAHEFGFIIRYPEGKEDITGYQYEPWHIRYVGKDLAKELYDANLTMEEFFDL